MDDLTAASYATIRCAVGNLNASSEPAPADRWHQDPELEPPATCPACGETTRWSHNFEICGCDRDRWPWR